MDVHQLFSSLKKEAECPLCLDTVKEPKTLPCLHSFCLECLDKHAGYARRQGKTMIKCPVCLADFNIPKSDTFSDLPTSFHLNRLVDILALKDDSVQIQTCNSCDDNSAVTSYCFVCQSFLCATCLEAHQRLKATRGHRNVLIEKLQAQDVEELIHRPVMCTQKYHENESLEYFCKDCNTCVCMKCGFVSHSRHTMLDIQQAAEERKVEITKAVDKAKAEIGVVQRKMERQKEFMKKSTDEMLAAESKVTAIVDELVRILREHEAAVKTRLIQINEAQQRDHATRTEEFQLTVSQLNGFVERGSAILNRNIPSEIIRTELTVTSRLEELSKAARVMILQPLHFSYVANEKLEKYRTIMENSGPGKVIASFTDPALSLAGCEPKVLDAMKPCSEVVFKLTTRDTDGNQIYNKEDNVTVQVNPPSEVEEEKEIKNLKDGNYSISVYPKLVGDHDIMIKLNGIPLTRKVKIAPDEDCTTNVARECESKKEFDPKDSGASKLRHSAAKRDNGFCGKRHTTEKPGEDCVTYRTAEVGRECKTSQKEFDLKEEENSNLRYGVAKRDNGFCSKRDPDEKTSEDYVKYRTAAVARECKASQQGFDEREKENSNLRCSVAKRDREFCRERDTDEKASEAYVTYRTAAVARECKAPDEDCTTNVARECKTSQKEFDLKEEENSNLRYGVAKRDNGFCSKRDPDEKTSEDYVKYRTAAVARECKASQQGFDEREKENSNLRCSVAKRDREFCRERDTEKASEAYVTYRTAAFARECKASQQGFDVGEKKNPNPRCSVAKRDKGFCPKRNTADRQSKDTADVERKCKASQQGLTRGKGNSNLLCGKKSGE